MEPLSSTPLEAAPLESSASFNSSSEGASSSTLSGPASVPDGPSAVELTPVISPDASISASIDFKRVCGTRPREGGNKIPLAPIPIERLCPGPNTVEASAPFGVKAISPFSIEVTC